MCAWPPAARQIRVTDRGRVVAEIVPPRVERSPMVAGAMLAEAVRRGWMTPPTFVADELPPRQPVMSVDRLMQHLREDREDR